MSAATPSSASEVTGLPAMPQATMCSRMYVRSVVMLSANPCIVRPRASRTPIAAIFRGSGPSTSTHTPGYWSSRPAPVTPSSVSASMRSCSTERTCSIEPFALGRERIG
jgi:hypothetical protein